MAAISDRRYKRSPQSNDAAGSTSPFQVFFTGESLEEDNVWVAAFSPWRQAASRDPGDLQESEPRKLLWIIVAGLCALSISYRFYSKWIAAKVLALNDQRATPALIRNDGKDFVPTNRWMVFGHHFAAIAGPGPLVGPVLAAQFGFLPGTLWDR